MLFRSIELTIVGGRIQRITCVVKDDPVYRAFAEQMSEALSEADQNWQLAEVGFGGNSLATISGCIMEDEAVRGTCHFCFGDNVRYGGVNHSSWHGGTVVVRQPKIEELP